MSSTPDEKSTRTPADLQAWIDANGIDASILYPEQETPSVPAAAEALGCEVAQIIKSILFLVDEGGGKARPVLVIASGTARIEQRILAARFGVGRKKVKLAGSDEVLAILGYPAGGVPPFGHRTPVPVLLEAAVLRQTVVFGGGGDHHSMVRLTVEELLRIHAPEVLPLTAAGLEAVDG